MNKNTKRWIPAAIVPVVIAVGAVAIPSVADASPALPEKTPQQVLELIATSSDTPYSGTIEQTSDLGLPDVSALGSAGGGSGDAASTAMELLTGSHSARVFVDGADGQRLQVLDSLAERDVVRNGTSVWLYDSSEKKAVHVTSALTGELPTAPAVTPAEAAAKLLAAVDSSTSVEVVDTARVAGRAAYQLRLTPKDEGTLVGTVTLSVDAETGLPLETTITAKGETDAAFAVAFSSIDFSAPDPALFDFTPPGDAEVTEKTITDADLPQGSPSLPAATPAPTVVGDGWDAIVELQAPDAAGAVSGSTDGESAALLDQLTTKVDGGRALSTSLVSVLLTDDGRVLVGAVGVAQLQAAAAQ